MQVRLEETVESEGEFATGHQPSSPMPSTSLGMELSTPVHTCSSSTTSPKTWSTRSYEGVTPTSSCDCTCYTIRVPGASGIVAVLLEAKMNSKALNAAAQVRGPRQLFPVCVVYCDSCMTTPCLFSRLLATSWRSQPRRRNHH